MHGPTAGRAHGSPGDLVPRVERRRIVHLLPVVALAVLSACASDVPGPLTGHDDRPQLPGSQAVRRRAAVLRILGAVVAALVLAGCGRDQGLLPCAEGDCVTGWTASCRTEGVGLRCALIDDRLAVVTTEGVWSVSGPAVVEAPGLVRPTGRGEVVVAVSHPRIGIGTIEAGRFLVDPLLIPLRMLSLAGSVERASDQKALAGARVTVSTIGEVRSRTAVTDARGQFRMEGVVTVVDLRWVAEKPGYVTRSGYFRLPDTEGGVEIPSGVDLAPVLPRLNLRLVEEPWRPSDTLRAP